MLRCLNTVCAAHKTAQYSDTATDMFIENIVPRQVKSRADALRCVFQILFASFLAKQHS